MNDREGPYGPEDSPPEAGEHFHGYDEHGRPVRYGPRRFRQAPDPYGPEAPHTPAEPYAPDASYAPGTPHAPDAPYAPYASYAPDAPYTPYVPGQVPDAPSDPHAPPGPSGDPYDPYAAGPWTAPQPAGPQEPEAGEPAWLPQQPPAPHHEAGEGYGDAAPLPGAPDGRHGAGTVPEAAPDAGYRTEQFSFVEEGNTESEDVIDWLKFSESRTERREEAKRRSRNRLLALLAALLVLLAGGVGYLWHAGGLPGLSDDRGGRAPAGDERRVIVVHLREIESDEVSTALLVNNETAGKGTTVLLPNALAVSSSGGTGGATTLGKVFEAEGAAATRDALGLLLGTEIKGTWRLDTPYLENWVELVGGITVDADTTVPAAERGGDPVVRKGDGRELDGRAAVAYATHRAAGEPQTKQLARFGQVVRATLAKTPSEPQAAVATVRNLAQIPDPSLSEEQLGASLAPLAEYARKGRHATELLPVRADGTLSDGTSEGLVRDVLGGTVSNTDPDAAPRVSLEDASGDRGTAAAARVSLVNGGYTVVGGGRAGSVRETSAVVYADASQEERALEVARTLGLPEGAVKRGEGAANADVTVVLGKDYGEGGADGGGGGS